MTSQYTFDAVIFGGGMVGATLAKGLARQGKNIAIVEPHIPQFDITTEAPDLRVSAISLGSENLLRELGIWGGLQKLRLKVYDTLSVWELPEFKTQFMASELQLSHLGHLMENVHLQQAALMSLDEHDCVSMFASGTLIDAKSGEVELDGKVSQAKVIVAADGGNSPLRQQMQFPISGWQYQQQVFAINIKLESDSGNHTWQQFFETGPRAFLPLYGQYASLVWYCAPEQVNLLKGLSANELDAEIRASFPALSAQFTILKTASFPLKRLHAHQYVKDRVVLVGDAAHIINPLAGQGVNLGFQDVSALLNALGKKTESSVSSVLKDYEAARKFQNLKMMSVMDGFYAGFSNQHLPLKVLRNIGLALADKAGSLKNMALKQALGI